MKEKKRPTRLIADRVLGAFGREDTPTGRRHSTRHLQDRPIHELEGREDIQKAYSSIRRGWRFGEEDFREWVMKEVAKGPTRARQSYSAGEIVAHDEAAAERLLKEEMKRAGLTEEQVRQLSRQDERKRAVARVIRSKNNSDQRWGGRTPRGRTRIDRQSRSAS